MLTKLKAKVKKGEQLNAEEQAFHTHLPSFIETHDAHPDAKSRKEFLDNERSIADKADQSKKDHLRMVSKELQKGMIEKHGDDPDAGLRKQIMDDVSPATLIPHLVAQTHVQKDGSAESLVHDSADIAKNHLSKFKNLHVADDVESGLVIRGYDEAGNLHNVATYGLKTQSGPHKNINATLTGIGT
jgi:hypothetical protein